MKRYCVTVQRTGCVLVDAENEEEAMRIANEEKTDSVRWDDDWNPVDVCGFQKLEPLTDDELWARAAQGGSISREELGIRRIRQ